MVIKIRLIMQLFETQFEGTNFAVLTVKWNLNLNRQPKFDLSEENF